MAVELPIPVAKLQRIEPVDFHGEIMPLLKRSCVACHHEKLAEGGLILETYEKILAGGDSGPAVVPGDFAASLLISRTTGEEEPLMPPEDNAAGAKPLTPEELGLLSLWIEQGAKASDQASTQPLQWQPIAPTLRPIYAVDVSSDGHFIASSRGNQVIIHDALSYEEVGRLVDPNLPQTAGEHAADIDLVQSLAFSPDGSTIATGGFRCVKLWAKRYEAVPLDDTPWAAAAGPVATHADGSRIAIASAINDIEIWNPEQNENVAILTGHRERICGLAFSQRDERLVSGDRSGRIILWNSGTGEKIAETVAPRPLLQLVATADTRLFATLDIQGQTSVFKVTQGDVIAIEPLELEAVKPIQDATAVAWISAEQPRLVVATMDAAVIIIDAASDKAIHSLKSEAAVERLAIDPAGKQLVTAARDGQINVWNVQSGELIRTLRGDPRRVRQAEQLQHDVKRQQGQLDRLQAFHEELEKRLAGEEEAIAKATEQRDKAAELVAEQTKKLQPPTEALAAAEATIAANNKRIDELEKKAAKQSEAAETAKAVAATQAAEAATAAETAKASADEVTKAKDKAETDKKTKANKKAEAADATAAELTAQLEAVRVETTKLTAGLEEKKKAVATAQEAKANSDAELAKLQSALDALMEARQRLIKTIAEHQTRTAKETQRGSLLETIQQRYRRDFAEHTAPATAMAFAPQGQTLATAHHDGTVRVYFGDETVARIVLDDFSSRRDASGALRQLRFIDDHTLVSLCEGASATAWRLRPVWTLQRSIGSAEDSPISDRVTAIDFHPDGSLLAVGSGPASRSGQLQIFSIGDGRLVRDFENIHSDTVLSVRFSPDGRTLASSAADKIIRLLDVTDGRVIRSLEGHTHHVLAVAWKDDAVTLASAGADQSIKVWNTETGEQKRTIGGVPKEVTAIRFVKDSAEILTAAADGNVRLHHADTGASIRSFNAAGDFLFSLAVSPDGNKVLSGGQSGVLRSWLVADGKLAAEMK